MSYQTRVYATGARDTSGWTHLLLGGVRESLSSRWETKEMAERYGEASVEINVGAGRPAEFEVVESSLPPQILASECRDV